MAKRRIDIDTNVMVSTWEPPIRKRCPWCNTVKFLVRTEDMRDAEDLADGVPLEESIMCARCGGQGPMVETIKGHPGQAAWRAWNERGTR